MQQRRYGLTNLKTPVVLHPHKGGDRRLKLEIRLKERKGKYPDRGNQRDLRKGNHRIVIKLLF
jgi:hypothetical protein